MECNKDAKECNKDEAIRVADMAELKLKDEDLVRAKKLILKALQLYPGLLDATKLSAVLDVRIAAQVKVGIHEPEPDYYGILQVKPLSDASTIKKKYRNLSRLVHPDKHKKSMKEEAEAAFMLIEEASKVLSDEKTRSQHNSKRGEKPTAKEPPKPTYSTHQPKKEDVKRGGMPRANPQPQPKTPKQEPPKATYSTNQPRYKAAEQPTPTPDPQASQEPYTFSAPASPTAGTQASQAPYTFWTPTSPAPGTQAFQAPYIFWTACPFCRTQYQCMGIFSNCQVVCHNCNYEFPANDISVQPANWASAFVWPRGHWGNNNPFPTGSWANMQMNENYLAPAYGAFTNGTFRNDLLSIFRGANPYGGYGIKLPSALLCLSMILLSAMNL